ncbi:uncharacterized protein LOC113873670 [Abrus precatorius]|uniref:Uncharacterized protein LOC113873670 n=1 Tax=Abrus precatorius TaxID=3816 RepID=A0A8B8MKD4_ABRPR|nr:uncharacterized protein LOC113873670 [Abrus precatorius]
MSPKYRSLCLIGILGMVLMASTSFANLQDRRLLSMEKASVMDTYHHHHHPHHPPATHNDPAKVENKQPQEEHTKVEDSHYKPPHKPWKKHPPSRN